MSPFESAIAREKAAVLTMTYCFLVENMEIFYVGSIFSNSILRTGKMMRR